MFPANMFCSSWKPQRILALMKHNGELSSSLKIYTLFPLQVEEMLASHPSMTEKGPRKNNKFDSKRNN